MVCVKTDIIRGLLCGDGTGYNGSICSSNCDKSYCLRAFWIVRCQTLGVFELKIITDYLQNDLNLSRNI